MRRPNRQIEVFDISLMAVVTKAMGAFLVMMLLLLPYYRSDPDFRNSTASLKSALAQAEQQLADMQRNLTGAQSATDPAEQQRLLDQARKALATMQSQLDMLTKQVDAMWSQLQQARDVASRSQAEAASLRAQLDAANQTIQSLNRMLADATSKAAEADSLRAQLQAAQQQLADLQSKQQEGAQQLQQAQQQASSMQTLLGDSALKNKWWEFVLYSPSPACGGIGRLGTLERYARDLSHESVLGKQADDFVGGSEQVIQLPITAAGMPADPEQPQTIFARSSGRNRLDDYLYYGPTAAVIPAGCSIAASIVVYGPSGSQRASAAAMPIAAGTEATVLAVLSTQDDGMLQIASPSAADVEDFHKSFKPIQDKLNAEAAAAAAKAATPPPAPPPPPPQAAKPQPPQAAKP